MIIKTWIRRRIHKLVSISSDSVYESVAYDPVKTRLSEAEELTNQGRSVRF